MRRTVAGGDVGQVALKTPVPIQCREVRLQDVGLRLCPKELQRSCVNLTLAGVLRSAQSGRREFTQFNKYYVAYLAKANATTHF